MNLRKCRVAAGFLLFALFISCWVLPASAFYYNNDELISEYAEQYGYPVYNFENVQTTGENLSGQIQDGGDNEDHERLYRFFVTLKPNTWYRISYSDAEAYKPPIYHLYHGIEESFNTSNAVVLESICDVIFYTGWNTDTECRLEIESPDPIEYCTDRYTLHELTSFDTVFSPRYSGFWDDYEQLFPNIDLSKYKGVTGNFIELITIYEDIEIAEDYTWDGHVYLYLYDACGKTVKGGKLTCRDNDGNLATFTLTPITGNGELSSNYFVKMEVNGHWWHQYAKNADGTVNIHSRRREIIDLTLNYSDKTSKTHPYNGYFLIEDKQTDGAVTSKSVTGNFESQVNLEINYTYYRTDTSPNGAHYHNQVDSIYFNVPNYLKESYGKLTDVKLSYQRARTEPIFVTDNTTLYQYLKDNLGKDASTYNSSLPRLYWIDSSHSNGINYGLTYNVKLGDSGTALFPFIHRSSREINRMVSAFLVDDVNAGIRAPESAVASEKLIKWMYDYTEKFGFGYPSSFVGPLPEGATTRYQGASGMVSGSFFSEADEVTTVNVAHLDLKADSYKKNHSFFSEWAEYGFRYATVGISTDLSLDLSEKIVAIEADWQLAGNSDKLYYAEMDESALQNCYNKSKANDSTMYLVRFNVSQYYEHPLTVDMDGKSYSDIAYMAEEDVYLNLHVLELTYKNELGVETPIPVSSNHIDCVADITQEKTPDQIEKQAGKELAAKIGGFWDGIFDKFKEIGKILALILGAVVLVLIAVFVVPVVSPILKTVFGAIGNFFRWIGEKFKGISAKRKQRRSGRK